LRYETQHQQGLRYRSNAAMPEGLYPSYILISPLTYYLEWLI